MMDRIDIRHEKAAKAVAGSHSTFGHGRPRRGDAPEVTAVLVTRGDVDLFPIAKPLVDAFGQWNVIVYDNSKQLDLGPFGQFFAAVKLVRSELCFFIDDDAVIANPHQVVDQWEPGKIVCNMTPAHQANYIDAPDRLMGFGSCFETKLISPTFDRYLQRFPVDITLMREPGRLFTGLNPTKVVDVPFESLPYATAENRLYKQPDHTKHRDIMRERVISMKAER